MPRLIGEYLRENGSLTCREIVLGLRQQVILRDQGVQARLGEILIWLGFITEEQLAAALSRQQRGREPISDPIPQPDVETPLYL